LVTAACSEGEERPSSRSKFTAAVQGGLQLDLDGHAGFWCANRPLKMCGLHLYPAGEGGDSINFTLTGSTRPPVGTYDISPDVDPSARSMRANYLSGPR